MTYLKINALVFALVLFSQFALAELTVNVFEVNEKDSAKFAEKAKELGCRREYICVRIDEKKKFRLHVNAYKTEDGKKENEIRELYTYFDVDETHSGKIIAFKHDVTSKTEVELYVASGADGKEEFKLSEYFEKQYLERKRLAQDLEKLKSDLSKYRKLSEQYSEAGDAKILLYTNKKGTVVERTYGITNWQVGSTIKLRKAFGDANGRAITYGSFSPRYGTGKEALLTTITSRIALNCKFSEGLVAKWFGTGLCVSGLKFTQDKKKAPSLIEEITIFECPYDDRFRACTKAV